MLTGAQLAPFLLATSLITLSPGPATALIVRHSAIHGFRSSVAVLAGIELGVFCWVSLAGIGVAGLVAASPGAFTVLKIVGAIVLLWMGIQAWRASFAMVSGPVDSELVGTQRAWRGFGVGLLTNLANPKAMVFCLAFFPQFIPAGAPVLSTTMFLAAIMIVIDTAWFVCLALAAHRAKGFFARAKVRRALDRVAGTVFVGLAARMVTLVR
ncbi:LysE family translocator [Nakamurella antarctica]|uniref:LysE family translocator n=1 Tax=Nakamurella antarctica TaxID=1902245 RepID=A0A3G8ZNG5_9ACTN|nr:LysE family translocator [Nakamurella antarctica]AZI58347.1 LysE family translocator [Nakamurella antarctica]